MVAFYPEIWLVHVAAVLTSGGLFVVRGFALVTGAGGAVLAALRYASYCVDTILLTAALMLMTIVQQYPFVHAWLTVKVLLLAVYVVLGMIAFRTTFSYRARLGCFAAAVTIYLFVISVARTHDPLGVLRSLVG